MTSNTFQVIGHYRGDHKNTVTFSLSACNQNQVYSFVRGFIPSFVITSLRPSTQKEDTHYGFSTVNPIISARFHRQNRRTHGCAVKAMARTRSSYTRQAID